MKSTKIILILIFLIAILYLKLCWAQEKGSLVPEVEQVKAELLQEASEDRNKDEYQPTWQKDFETLQRQAQDAMAQNIRLNIEYKLLEKETVKLSKEVKDRQEKNQDFRKKVGELKDLSNAGAWKAKVLAQERQFQNDLDIKNKELRERDSKIKFLEQKIAVARLKLRLMGVEDHSDKLLSLQEERDTLEDIYEPYLLQAGFLARTSRGRIATDLAYSHLKKKRLKESQAEFQAPLFSEATTTKEN